MLKHIIMKEIIANITSPKLVFSFVLCTVLVLVSLYTGTVNYRDELVEYHEARSMNLQHLEDQPDWRNLGSAKWALTKRPPILSTIAGGIHDAVGRNTDLRYRKLIDSRYESNPVFAVDGPLDVAMIVKIVLSLFGVLFTFDAICGEKEKGTLKLVLSNQIPRNELILGKTVGSFVSFLVPLGIPLVMGLLFLNVCPDVSFSGDDWARLGLILLCFLLYLTVFFNLGLFISSRCGRSSDSLFILLFVWIILVLVIPRAATAVSERVLSIPTIHEVEHRIREATREIEMREQPKIDETLAKWWREHGMVEDWSANPSEKRRVFLDLRDRLRRNADAMIDAERAGISSDYRAELRKQQMLAFSLSRISPTAAMTYSTLRLARTGMDAHQRFVDSIGDYGAAVSDWLAAKPKQNGQVRLGEDGRGKPREAPSLDGMPQHEVVPERFSESLYSVLPDVCILLLMNIILFAAAYVSFLSYDVR